MSASTVDRAQSFQPDHTFEFAYALGSKEVWKCDGSCGIENCDEKRTFYE